MVNSAKNLALGFCVRGPNQGEMLRPPRRTQHDNDALSMTNALLQQPAKRHKRRKHEHETKFQLTDSGHIAQDGSSTVISLR
jgi:hypothetical protein